MDDEVGKALSCWREASRQLDDVIGVNLDDEAMAPLPIPLDVDRFRRALLAEQLARAHYVALLRNHHEPVPAELVWDAPAAEPDRSLPAPRSGGNVGLAERTPIQDTRSSH